jgi:hypothetical protein
VWHNTGSFPTSQQTFCDVYGAQLDTAEMNVMSAFEHILNIALVQLTVDETNTSDIDFEKFEPVYILL